MACWYLVVALCIDFVWAEKLPGGREASCLSVGFIIPASISACLGVKRRIRAE